MLKHIISYTFIFSIFLSSLMINISGVSIDIYWYFPLFFIVLFYFIYSGILYKIERNVLVTILFIACFSVVTGYANLTIVIKQLTNILFFLITSYAYLRYMDFDLDAILKYYFSVAKIFLVVGLLQITLFALGLANVYKSAFSFLTIPGSMTIRFQSFDREPSFAAYTMLPALFFSFHNIIHNSKFYISRSWSFLFILAYLLTFSIVAYIGVAIALFIFYFNRFRFKKTLYILPLSFVLYVMSFAVYKYPPVKMRIDDSIEVVREGVDDPRLVNQSTFALYSNFIVTESAVRNKPFFGSGIGTHEVNYAKFIPNEFNRISNINKKEAASLALRLLSEGGIVGFSLFIFFLFWNKIKFHEAMDRNAIKIWLLNNSIFVMIILRLARQGHYTVSGFCLFILIYYFSKKNIRNKTA